MFMKKKYVSPQVDVIKLDLDSTLLAESDVNQGEGNDGDFGSREDYYDNTPSRPGSTNIWDQGW